MVRLTRLVPGFLVAMATVIEVTQGHMTQALYHTSINFTCTPSANAIDLSTVLPADLRRFWILPNGDLLTSTTTGNDRVDVLNEGSVLHVRDVDDEDFGMYYCLLLVEPMVGQYLQIHGLNVGGPYWGDLFETRYRSMVITGVVACAVCFVTMSLICLLYNKQQVRKDHPPEEDKAADMDVSKKGINEKPGAEEHVTQYDNPAYVTDAESTNAQNVVTNYPSVGYAEERAGSKKKRLAPGPPAETTTQQQQQQEELQNVVAAVEGERAVTSTARDTRL